MKPTAEMLDRIAGASAKRDNINSLGKAFDHYGERYGIRLSHRLARFFSASFI